MIIILYPAKICRKSIFTYLGLIYSNQKLRRIWFSLKIDYHIPFSQILANHSNNSFIFNSSENKLKFFSFDLFQFICILSSFHCIFHKGSINLLCVPLGCFLSGVLTEPTGKRRAMQVNIQISPPKWHSQLSTNTFFSFFFS